MTLDSEQTEERGEQQRGARASGQQRQRSSRGQRSAAARSEEAQAAQNGLPPPRLQETYRNEIVPTMMSEFGFPNVMRVPRLQKIVLNIGLGEALTNSRAMESATRDLATISGQKPIITKARKSIAGFKVREGNPIGTCVTLRGARMHHFLDRLINTALPRIRDFRGISRRGFDGRGNFSLGIREQIIFPEIDYNQIDRIRGLQVTIATTAQNDAEAMRLLELFGMPFVRQT
jgi:large subunit ribosomal protein L5